MQINTVLALGDSSYEKFCATGVLIDEKLHSLGAERLHPRLECDVDFEKYVLGWIATITELLPTSAPSMPSSKAIFRNTSTTTYSKDRPFCTEVLANRKLSGTDSVNPVHHIELACENQAFKLAAGDAVGILPENPSLLVSLILEGTNLSGYIPISAKGQTFSLEEGLKRYRDLTIPSRDLLEYWSSICGNENLRTLLAGDKGKIRKFLRSVHVRDIIRLFPASPSAQLLFDALRPIQPRLYDLANCLSTIPDELHLTVELFDYSFLDRTEIGIASQFLTELTPGDSVFVYPHINTRFQLPKNPKSPIILIAEGTGIAPYRAFIQVLSRRIQRPESWLIFAEERFEQDFYYQLEIQKARADGVLTFVDTVFSKDAPRFEVRDLFVNQKTRILEWLDRDGHIYFCGDKLSLEDTETGLEVIIDNERGEGYWRSLLKDKRVHRNLY